MWRKQHERSLLKSLRRLQTSHEYSDLKIFCQDKVFEVHKAIVCSRSRYLATSCTWGKDSKPKEEIELQDEDATLVGLMLDYLYQLDYDDLLPSQVATQSIDELPEEPEAPADVEPSTASNITSFEYRDHELITEAPATALAPEPTIAEQAPTALPRCAISPAEFEWAMSSRKSKKDKKRRKSAHPQLKDRGVDLKVERLVINTLMYALADKFDIEDLKTLAKEKFAAAVEQDWESLAFVHAAELAFETTPSSDQGLRSIVIRMFNEHRELVNYEQVQKLLDSGNGMAWALVQRLLNDQPDLRETLATN